MKITALLLLFFSSISYAQVGIGTVNPQGTLDITSVNDTGLVIPRVSSIEAVTDGSANPAVNGTVVYDISRQKTCYRISGNWVCTGFDSGGNIVTEIEAVPPSPIQNVSIDSQKK